MSRVTKQYKVMLKDWQLAHVNRLARKANQNMVGDLKAAVELWIDDPIRKVVAYEEKTVNGGYCDTCSFYYIEFHVYFKSQEGVLCKYTYDGTFAELMNQFSY